MRRLVIDPLASADMRGALRASRLLHGAAAQQRYDALLKRAYQLLRIDPHRAGVARPEGLAEGVSLYHVRHARTRGGAPRQPRHIVAFIADADTLIVLRVLHDAMDVAMQLSPTEE